MLYPLSYWSNSGIIANLWAASSLCSPRSPATQYL